MADVEIGRGKSARRGYGFDDIAVVPSRRTRDPEDVSVAWQIDAYRFEVPFVVAPMDSVISPETAIAIGRLGGLGVLDLEGLWTRYDDPEPLLEEIAGLAPEESTARLQQLYAEPIREELIVERIAQIRDAGVTTAAALSPQRTAEFHKAVLRAGVDLFVIRGTVVSAEHVSTQAAPLNLKQFIYELDVPVIVGGCATYQAALHLMRTGAAGVLVGVGGGPAHTTRKVLGIGVPMATAVSDVASARRDYMDESGGRYVHVICDGGMANGGDIAKAVACGADAVMIGMPLARATEAPGRGWHWGPESTHETLPRGARVKLGTVGSLEQILFGPSHVTDGTMNIVGALRRAMATTGYSDLKEFQRVEVVVNPGALAMRVVFVHGALVRDGAWWWHRVAALLEQQGISSFAPLLPSCGETGVAPGFHGGGFLDDVGSVRRALLASDEPVTVVAHSYGGMVVAEAAYEVSQVQHLLYISSVLPMPGQSLASLGAEGPPPPWIQVDPVAGTFALDPSYLAGTYLQDCPSEVVTPALERLVPQSVSVTMAEPVVAGWQGVPSTYVVCTDDLGSPADWQRTQAARAGRVVELHSGHHPFLSMPEAVAALVA